MRKVTLFFAVIIVVVIVSGEFRRFVIPKTVRLWSNYLMSEDGIEDIMLIDGDVLNGTSPIVFNLRMKKTSRVGICARYDSSSTPGRMFEKSHYNGLLKVSVKNGGTVLGSFAANSTMQHFYNESSAIAKYTEVLHTFDMPYSDKYEDVTVHMDVVKRDPSYEGGKVNLYWAICDVWYP
jgi:hypothetical protein